MKTNAWHAEDDPEPDASVRPEEAESERPLDDPGINPDEQPGFPDDPASPAEGGD